MCDNFKTKPFESSTQSSPTAESAVRALYVHSPFCVRRCPYCDFSIALFTDRVLPAQYLRGLELEVGRLRGRHAPRTIFVGGGTPTVLKPDDLQTFFQILWKRFDRSRLVEFSIEANPENLRPDRIACLVEHGITRVSLGAQSFDPSSLQFLGRRHEPATIEQAVLNLRTAGIPRINIDLIYGLPCQTVASLENDLEHLIRLRCDHVSAYSLTYEPGTELTASRDRGEILPLEDRQEIELYRVARDRLVAAGFQQYEISTFARPGARCRHNLTYWRNQPYLGLGPSAVSYVGGTRWKNQPMLAEWCRLLEQGLDPVVERETLEPARSLRETVMLALRTTSGITDASLRRRHGSGLEALDPQVLNHLAEHDLLVWTPDRIRPTPRGIEMADGLAAALL